MGRSSSLYVNAFNAPARAAYVDGMWSDTAGTPDGRARLAAAFVGLATGPFRTCRCP